MERKYVVYKHTSPNGKVYIGITKKKPEHRWNNGKGYKGNIYFYNAILKYGWDNFTHEVLFSNQTKEAACEIEKNLIAKYDSTNKANGYNITIGGNIPHNYGKHLKKETREKISQSKCGTCVGEQNSFYGKKHTEEAKKKMSNAHKGRPSHFKGKKRSDETKMKQSIPVICVETNIVYFGINEAERKTGIANQSISKCASGKRKTAGGYHWKYADVI
jgi:group I intron endonuclease